MRRIRSLKKPKRIQDKIVKPKVQEKFILSISGSESEKAQIINKSNLWGSPASENKVKKFAFFTRGESKKVRYWMAPKLFIVFFNIPNPPIEENYFISHKFYSDKYVSFHLSPAACSNMIYFMDKVKDVLAKNELFDRILLLAEKNNVDPILGELVNKSSIPNFSNSLDLQIAIPGEPKETQKETQKGTPKGALSETENDYSPTSSQVYKLTKEDGELDYSTTAKTQDQLSENIKQLDENSESSPSLFISPPSSSDSKNNSAFKAASAMKDTYLDSTSHESYVSVSSSFRSRKGRRSSSVRPKKREKDNTNSNNNPIRRSNRNSINNTSSQNGQNNKDSSNKNKSSRTRRNVSVSRKNRNSINSKNEEQSGNNFESTGSRRYTNNLDSTGSKTRKGTSPKNNELSSDIPISSTIPISSSPLSRMDEVNRNLKKLRNRRNPNINTDSYGSRRNQNHRIIQSIQEDEYYDYFDEEEELFDEYQNENSSNKHRLQYRKTTTIQTIKSRNNDDSSLNNNKMIKRNNNTLRNKRSSQNYEEDEIDSRYGMDSHPSRKIRRSKHKSQNQDGDNETNSTSPQPNRIKTQRSSPKIRKSRTQDDDDDIELRYGMGSGSGRNRIKTIDSVNRNRNRNATNKSDEGSPKSTGSHHNHKRSASSSHRLTTTTITTTTTTMNVSGRPQPSSINTQRIKTNRRSQSITNHKTNNTYDGTSQPSRIRNSIGPSSRIPSITFDDSPTNHVRHTNFASDHVRYNFNQSSLLSNSATRQTNSDIKKLNNQDNSPGRIGNDENYSSNDNFNFDLSPNEEMNEKGGNDADDIKEVSVLKIVSDGTSSITKKAPELNASGRKKPIMTQRVKRKSSSNMTKKITHTTKIVRNNSWNSSIENFDKPSIEVSSVPSGSKCLNESTNPDDEAVNFDETSSEDNLIKDDKKNEAAAEVSDSIEAALPSIDLKPDPIQKKE